MEGKDAKKNESRTEIKAQRDRVIESNRVKHVITPVDFVSQTLKSRLIEEEEDIERQDFCYWHYRV